ncbi:hypothetical protein PT974_04337 [Cladobotryum mycophilum]|uniref:Tse2 ADP-ribosyltransferase toxin domain-containing protein n=1 Tax=Cladobotryum mycophilum TaxID=491253 RepID=A0ABR0SUT4_9HYPO
MSNLVAVFRHIPKQLFRVNNGPRIGLRPWAPGLRSYDVVLEDGRVQPRALSPSTYKSPNGVSMRSNSPHQRLLISRLYKAQNLVIYAIPAGTRLPDDLLLVHERADHYSLQPARDMGLKELNNQVTNFFIENGTVYTRKEWLKTFRQPTDVPDVGK